MTIICCSREECKWIVEGLCELHKIPITTIPNVVQVKHCLDFTLQEDNAKEIKKYLRGKIK